MGDVISIKLMDSNTLFRYKVNYLVQTTYAQISRLITSVKCPRVEVLSTVRVCSSSICNCISYTLMITTIT